MTANGGYSGAGIGGGDHSAGGTVTINGGTVSANGGSDGAGIGGGYHGTGGTVTINGGTVTAQGGSQGDSIGGGTVTVSGGSIKASSIQSQPKNAADAPVYCVTVPCTTSPGSITGLGDYGTKGIVPLDGKVYLWLPDGTHLFNVDGVTYRAVVNGAAVTAGLYPMCEGGEIAEGEGGEWIVTPSEGVTEVKVANLPEGASVAVKCGDYAVPSAAFVGFGEGKTEGVFSLALDPEGMVTIGDETIPVKPTIGDLDAGEPFVIGDAGAAVTVKAIPGLKYALLRTAALGDSGWATVGEPVVADGATVTLTDEEPPENQAFYCVEVSGGGVF